MVLVKLTIQKTKRKKCKQPQEHKKPKNSLKTTGDYFCLWIFTEHPNIFLSTWMFGKMNWKWQELCRAPVSSIFLDQPEVLGSSLKILNGADVTDFFEIFGKYLQNLYLLSHSKSGCLQIQIICMKSSKISRYRIKILKDLN